MRERDPKSTIQTRMCAIEIGSRFNGKRNKNRKLIPISTDFDSQI